MARGQRPRPREYPDDAVQVLCAVCHHAHFVSYSASGCCLVRTQSSDSGFFWRNAPGRYICMNHDCNQFTREPGQQCQVCAEAGITTVLMEDGFHLLTSFCARLYGKRSARNRAIKALNCAKADIGPADLSRTKERAVL